MNEPGLRLTNPVPGKCVHCNRPILKTQPGDDGWIHKWSDVEWCDRSREDGPRATPRREANRP